MKDVIQKLEKSERIVFLLLHGGDYEDFKKRLKDRPDWQMAINTVRKIIMTNLPRTSATRMWDYNRN